MGEIRTMKKKDYVVGVDTRNEIEGLLEDFTGALDDISEEWNKIRSNHGVIELKEVLSEKLIDALDGISDILVCETEDCRNIVDPAVNFCDKCSE